MYVNTHDSRRHVRVSSCWRWGCPVYVWTMLQALGISVEFCAHVVHGFVVAPGTRPERMTAAVTDVGASVLSGITLTKFVGVHLTGLIAHHSARCLTSQGQFCAVVEFHGYARILYVCER